MVRGKGWKRIQLKFLWMRINLLHMFMWYNFGYFTLIVEFSQIKLGRNYYKMGAFV